MKKVRHIATFADLLILAIIVIINPTSPFTPYQPFKAPCIPDKIEVRYSKILPTDSIAQSLKRTEAQLSEMQYYLKVHNVTDEGYNQVAGYNQTLLNRKNWLQKMSSLSQNTRLSGSSSQTIRIPAKERPLIAVKLSKGYWRAGHFHLMPFYGKAITRDDQGICRFSIHLPLPAEMEKKGIRIHVDGRFASVPRSSRHCWSERYLVRRLAGMCPSVLGILPLNQFG